jgi:hypothetical protein
MMFIGHVALGGLLTYMLYRSNIKDFLFPFVLFFSILPDIDIVLGHVMANFIHKTITHSIFVLLVFGLVYLFYRKRSVMVYMACYGTHFLGDLMVEQVNLFYPFTTFSLGTGIRFTSFTDILLELLLFVVYVAFTTFDKKYLMCTIENYFRSPLLNRIFVLALAISMVLSFSYSIKGLSSNFILGSILILSVHLLACSFFVLYLVKAKSLQT